MRAKWIEIILAVAMMPWLAGCPIFRATGDAVEATGEGAGTVVRGVGTGVEEAVSGAGAAVSSAAE